MKYSFMTFSCPELALEEVLALARRFGYDGIEPRLDAGHAHGVEVAADAGARADIRRAADEAGVALACLATSCRFADPCERERNVEDARRRIDLAADVRAPAIRVFGGKLAEGQTRDDAVEGVADALRALGQHAERRGITVCMETHDDWCDPQHVAAVMRKVRHTHVGVNWDVMHPVRRAQATMDSAFEALRPWIRHLHVHDADGRTGRLVPIGAGAYDHRRVVELLRTIDFAGYLSGEWIKWDDPYEAHLPREIKTLRAYEAQTAGTNA